MRVEGKKILLITMLWFAPLMLVAQNPPPPDSVVMDGTPPPPVGLPIDFGISALIAAGLGLGIHHIRNRK